MRDEMRNITVTPADVRNLLSSHYEDAALVKNDNGDIEVRRVSELDAGQKRIITREDAINSWHVGEYDGVGGFKQGAENWLEWETVLAADLTIRTFGYPEQARRNVEADGLRARRKAIGFTQQQLAGHLGVARATINRWEQGHEQIPKWLALALNELGRTTTE